MHAQDGGLDQREVSVQSVGSLSSASVFNWLCMIRTNVIMIVFTMNWIVIGLNWTVVPRGDICCDLTLYE